MKNGIHSALLSLAGIATFPAFAQDAQEQADDADSTSDIIVTAQRTEQKLQDVPISITVLTQETLANNNISNAKDLAAFTPGLAVNNRYGSDNTVFTIRGFYQEQRSFATVGVFFADVVAPRGSLGPCDLCSEVRASRWSYVISEYGRPQCRSQLRSERVSDPCGRSEERRVGNEGRSRWAP